MSYTFQYPPLLSLTQAGALLQRHLPDRDAISWLNTDRKNNPTIPFIEADGRIFYSENDLITFLSHFSDRLAIRRKPDRRFNSSRRIASSERRFDIERRRRSLGGVRNLIDRRFKLRQDQRGDIDRRLLGGMDRRSMSERRGRET
ncbi:hypothetical protein [Sulfurirhabdus autotrophica]|uniref:Pyocin activator protein PrtN n=1 Tax=Sulfurirhabdus autotrophica TaxID=1706046 RepID=A0A4V2W0V4_9PROT|nr:hypothetical protein [Sulfurirhabdus autotrophica]TCV80229.1 hypothetical protein EDC63_12918 [Sulfurirhabdus autotrophica]